MYVQDHSVQDYRAVSVFCMRFEDEIAEITETSIREWLAKKAPSLIVTGTSADDFTEKYIWAGAAKLGIPTIAVLDSWCNYGIRFSSRRVGDMESVHKEDLIYYPDWIVAMDSYAREKLIADGVDEKRIVVLGQPWLDSIPKAFQDVDTPQIAAYRKKIRAGERKIILYASDNISEAYPSDGEPYWGYDEKTIFLNLMEAIQGCNYSSEEYVLVVRPHPKEAVGKWEALIESAKYNVPVVLDQNSKGTIAIRAADLVIGTMTMFLVEAAIAETPILSAVIGESKRAPFILTERELVEPAKTQKELNQAMQAYFSGTWDGRVDWKLDGNATDRIVKFIEQHLEEI